MNVVQRLKEASILVEQVATDLSEQVTKSTDELQGLSENIARAKEESAALDASLKEQQAVFDRESASQKQALAEITKDVEAKKGEFERISANVETAKKTHNQFVQYEITHRKVLESREESLKEREEAIKSVVGQMKRRNKIVDEINS